MKQDKISQPEKQTLAPLDIRIRIMKMQESGDYSMLEKAGQYLADKLNRSEGAISNALNDKSPVLLARIAQHLDWLESKRMKKQTGKIAA